MGGSQVGTGLGPRSAGGHYAVVAEEEHNAGDKEECTGQDTESETGAEGGPEWRKVGVLPEVEMERNVEAGGTGSQVAEGTGWRVVLMMRRIRAAGLTPRPVHKQSAEAGVVIQLGSVEEREPSICAEGVKVQVWPEFLVLVQFLVPPGWMIPFLSRCST